jgi:hypothetical protein
MYFLVCWSYDVDTTQISYEDPQQENTAIWQGTSVRDRRRWSLSFGCTSPDTNQ